LEGGRLNDGQAWASDGCPSHQFFFPNFQLLFCFVYLFALNGDGGGGHHHHHHHHHITTITQCQPGPEPLNKGFF
jgi:hypothetical protein